MLAFQSFACTGLRGLGHHHGAQLPDPKKLFNAGLDGNTWRAIGFREGDTIDKTPCKALLREAVADNTTHSLIDLVHGSSARHVVDNLSGFAIEDVEWRTQRCSDLRTDRQSAPREG